MSFYYFSELFLSFSHLQPVLEKIFLVMCEKCCSQQKYAKKTAFEILYCYMLQIKTLASLDLQEILVIKI